jgi:3-mercaptopropionate dioxygenase
METREYKRADPNGRIWRPTSGAETRFGDLVSAVRTVTRRPEDCTEPADWTQTAGAVADQLRLHLPSPDILTAEQRYGDPLHYQCHVLHVEPDGSFSVLALVWRPGQATPIHDHVSWCVTGVIQGCEHEERYELGQDGWLVQTGTADSREGDVAGLAPPGDIHRVRNADVETAISVHIYGTDISRLGSSIRRVYNRPVSSAGRLG